MGDVTEDLVHTPPPPPPPCFFSPFRYLKWTLGGNIGMVARCEFDAITPTAGGNFYINIKALNEWDPKVRSKVISHWFRAYNYVVGQNFVTNV